MSTIPERHHDADTRRDGYPHFTTITTRWIDNDLYGHVNNVAYYQFFDTVANGYLIEHCGLDIHTGPVIGFIVASSCQYLSPIVHPDIIDAAFRVNRLGSRSVEYGIGIFAAGQQQAAAYGTFTHVFVARNTQQAVEIPAPIRAGLARVIRRSH